MKLAAADNDCSNGEDALLDNAEFLEPRDAKRIANAFLNLEHVVQTPSITFRRCENRKLSYYLARFRGVEISHNNDIEILIDRQKHEIGLINLYPTRVVELVGYRRVGSEIVKFLICIANSSCFGITVWDQSNIKFPYMIVHKHSWYEKFGFEYTDEGPFQSLMDLIRNVGDMTIHIQHCEKRWDIVKERLGYQLGIEPRTVRDLVEGMSIPKDQREANRLIRFIFEEVLTGIVPVAAFASCCEQPFRMRYRRQL